MRVIRTLAWVVLTAALVAFIAMNWERAPVNFWPLETGYLHFEWPVGIIALVFLALGLVPMWLYHKAGRWQMKRRINALESTARGPATPSSAPNAPPPLATSTQLDKAQDRAQSESPTL